MARSFTPVPLQNSVKIFLRVDTDILFVPLKHSAYLHCIICEYYFSALTDPKFFFEITGQLLLTLYSCSDSHHYISLIPSTVSYTNVPGIYYLDKNK